MELLLASCQSRSVFSFLFLLQCSQVSPYMDGLSLIYGLGPLIPALLMTVVNWWEAKGQDYLQCCDVT